MTSEEAEALQQAYHDARECWAREIGFPYHSTKAAKLKRKPEPATVDALDEELG